MTLACATNAVAYQHMRVYELNRDLQLQQHKNLASFPGPAQLFVACVLSCNRKRPAGLGTRLTKTQLSSLRSLLQRMQSRRHFSLPTTPDYTLGLLHEAICLLMLTCTRHTLYS